MFRNRFLSLISFCIKYENLLYASAYFHWHEYSFTFFKTPCMREKACGPPVTNHGDKEQQRKRSKREQVCAGNNVMFACRYEIEAIRAAGIAELLSQD